MWRRSVGNVGILVTAAFVLSACGAVDEDTVSEAQSQTVDTVVVVDEPADEQPEALALRENDAGSEELAEPTETAEAETTEPDSADAPAESLPPIDELDAGLAEFAGCLNDNGVDVAPFTLQDMVAKASGMPLIETRAEMFAFFLDADGTDPAFVQAVDACNSIVDAIPGLGAFLPDA